MTPRKNYVVREAHLRSRVCCSYAYAMRNMRASSNGRATICAHRERPVLLTVLPAGCLHEATEYCESRMQGNLPCCMTEAPTGKLGLLSCKIGSKPIRCTSYGSAACELSDLRFTTSQQQHPARCRSRALRRARSGAAAALSEMLLRLHIQASPHSVYQTWGRTCSEVGNGAWVLPLVKPMGTTIAGAPVGGGICGESLPARTITTALKLERKSQNSKQQWI